MDLSKAKSVFFKILIGCLVAAAALAVVTVLIGSFNDILGKALFTILLVAFHSLVSISFIDNSEKKDVFGNLTFFTNATFTIIVLSFITSILGTWGVVQGGLVWRLYALYLVLLFAVLHGEVLAQIKQKQSSIDAAVNANYAFMVVVVVLLLPVIFMTDSSTLDPFYYRFLAAAGIIDATLTLVAVIIHHLYLQKHPKVVDPVFSMQQVQPLPGQPAQPGQNMQLVVQPKRRMNPLLMVLLAYIVLQAAATIVIVAVKAMNP